MKHLDTGCSFCHLDPKNGTTTDRFLRFNIDLEQLGKDLSTALQASHQFSVDPLLLKMGSSSTDKNRLLVKVELFLPLNTNALLTVDSNRKLPSLPTIEDLVTQVSPPIVSPQRVNPPTVSPPTVSPPTVSPIATLEDIPLDLSIAKPTTMGVAKESRKPRIKTPRPNYQTDFVCQNCNKTFGRKSGLVQHINSKHSGPCPFKCGHCGKRFPEEALLTKHQTLHYMVDKPYKCKEPGCASQFVHKNDLNRHNQGTHGEARFVCVECEKRFVRNDHLLLHMQVHDRKRQREEKELELEKRRKLG